MSLFNFTLVLLGTFYLSYVMVYTKGPGGLFAKIRFWLPLGGVTQCIYCLSLWIGAIACIIVLSPVQVIIYPFAAAGAAMLLFRFTGADHT